MGYSSGRCDFKVIYVPKQNNRASDESLHFLKFQQRSIPPRILRVRTSTNLVGMKTFLSVWNMHGATKKKNVTTIFLQTASHDLSFYEKCMCCCCSTARLQTSVRLGRNQSADPRRGIIHLHWDAHSNKLNVTLNKSVEDSWSVRIHTANDKSPSRGTDPENTVINQ